MAEKATEVPTDVNPIEGPIDANPTEEPYVIDRREMFDRLERVIANDHLRSGVFNILDGVPTNTERPSEERQEMREIFNDMRQGNLPAIDFNDVLSQALGLFPKLMGNNVDNEILTCFQNTMEHMRATNDKTGNRGVENLEDLTRMIENSINSLKSDNSPNSV
jgi:hypothetical protein